MDRQELLQNVLALPVWDTHTHLVPDLLPAQTFWDIGHYFWFLRELQAAGYPAQPDELPEDARIDAYLRAFDTTRNTSMNWVVRHILSELYQIELTDAQSIRAADRAVRQSAADPTWPRRVVTKLSIRRICIHAREPTEFKDLPGVCAIAGARNAEQAIDNAKAGTVTLTPEEMDQMDRISRVVTDQIDENPVQWKW